MPCWPKETADTGGFLPQPFFFLLKTFSPQDMSFPSSLLPSFKNLVSSSSFTSGHKISQKLFWRQLFQEHLYFNRKLCIELGSLSSHWHLSGNLRILPGRILLAFFKSSLLAWCLHLQLLLEYRLLYSCPHQGRMLQSVAFLTLSVPFLTQNLYILMLSLGLTIRLKALFTIGKKNEKRRRKYCRALPNETTLHHYHTLHQQIVEIPRKDRNHYQAELPFLIKALSVISSYT